LPIDRRTGSGGAATFLFDGLVADRNGSVNDFRVECGTPGWRFVAAAVDLRAGFGRLPWGRLDEVQPTDLINPLDTSRRLLDGRSDARRAVGFVRRARDQLRGAPLRRRAGCRSSAAAYSTRSTRTRRRST
jgi:hypothetical protein